MIQIGYELGKIFKHTHPTKDSYQEYTENLQKSIKAT